jgi:hypothetical protein
MGRVLRTVASVAVAVVAVVALLLFLQSRDKSTLDNGDSTAKPTVRTVERDQGNAHRKAPAGFRYATDPPTSGPHLPVRIPATGTLTNDELLHALELGDVVLVYGKTADGPVLAALRDDVAGNDPALVGAGQAIVLDQRPGTAGVVALAWRRLLRVKAANDPRLREFAQAWLGHGASP